jgi:hypothetical protein
MKTMGFRDASNTHLVNELHITAADIARFIVSRKTWKHVKAASA